jgi:hypothetical protein
MLKKVYHIVVMLVLILGTSGITVSHHYCHGKLISSGIYSEAKSCCDSSCGACENKTSIHRINDNFISSSYTPGEIKEIQIFTIDFLVIIPQNYISLVFTISHYTNHKAPPGYSSLPEYLEVFRC